MRKLVIAVLPAALVVAHAGAASAWIALNGGGENGIRINGVQVNGGGSNGGGPNGIHINGGGSNGQGPQGVSPTGAVGATVISIELPVRVAR